MELRLEGVAHRVGAQDFLYPLDLALRPGTLTVLLGATQAGKTTLMRLMAGLDRPTRGRVHVDGRDVTGVPVRQRNVSMVYQQFINYPSLTVFDNIASPLRLRGTPRQETARRVQAIAQWLHIEPFLQRLPEQLSGGQQQRVALARALAKQASLVLLDEPLVNLDYKLREGLREELGALFSTGDATVVYATTEPGEALLLGGWTAVLDAGELLQYGPTAEVFHRPASLRVARAFSDPPMNLMAAQAANLGVQLASGLQLSVPLPPQAAARLVGRLTLGVRANALRLQPREGDVALPGCVELAEIAGSYTFVHVDTAVGELVAQLSGVHALALGEAVELYLQPAQAYLFDGDGTLLRAPQEP
ncbi:ABC transporter ATP-binding protein [uncultured Azohydromonas sp.]|jgi:ABC-type sugar transport systems, ATPase components|uniref:ABC transporter ATP-binding protein n=1 Tax=uncultured Azohydromonas sp. TaxID=487342 RepID=UPI0026185D64|nr:ABC transporter ATP-binding protein [uncultured Azohydromonas sp.]